MTCRMTLPLALAITVLTTASAAEPLDASPKLPASRKPPMFQVPARHRPPRRRNALVLGKLIAGGSAGLMAFACMAVPANMPSTTVPENVRALVAPTDKLLAYKPADLYGDGTPGAVLVVRHQASEKSDYDFENNPCELIVLHQRKNKLVEVAHSKKTVDCTYNDVARNAPALSLNDNLLLAPGSIVYVNQKEKGDSTFYFAWSKERNAWYLQRATASNPDSGSNIAHVGAIYPGNLAWTPMSSVDPEAIAEVLQKQGKTTD